jgi:hypothetical protein
MDQSIPYGVRERRMSERAVMGSSGRTTLMRTADRGLMWHGMFLFLIGLVTGLNERRFTNMRMALSAHL